MASGERSTVVATLALSITISLSFRVIGVPRTQGWLRRWATAGTNLVGRNVIPTDEIHSVRRAQRIVLRATGIGTNCLVKSLTLWALLLRQGVPTNLRVGFRKRGGRIEGHAWVEHDDSPINESINEVRTFTPYGKPASFDLWRRVG
jgi:hypothetical protein